MLTEDDLTPDQEIAIDRLFNYDATYLVAPTGAGKTVVLLTAAGYMLEADNIDRLLIIAPLRVCETVWDTECKKWQHLRDLNISIAVGDPEYRLDAFECGDIVVVNEENVVWLVDAGLLESFDAIVIDESSKWAEIGGARFKKLRRKMKHFKWRVLMTSEPVAESWDKMYGQMLLCDSGARLGTSHEAFQLKYMRPTDWEQRKWVLRAECVKPLTRVLDDIVHTMPDYKGDLPPLNIDLHYINMPRPALRIYDRMRIDSVCTLPSGDEIEAETMAVRSGKLEQLASGFAYLDEAEETDDAFCDRDPAPIRNRGARILTRLHLQKQAWLERRSMEILNAGESVIIVYWFAAELEWLKTFFHAPLIIAGCPDTPKLIKQWQKTRRQVLLLHPASAAHGVDGLQKTCNRELWLGPLWSRDKQEQTYGRIHRRGQTEEVFIEICMMRGTIDEVKWASCQGKGEHKKLFLEHLGPDRNRV